MTIISNEHLSMAETAEYVEKDSEMAKFIKKFTKITPKEAAEFRKNLADLDIMKMKSEEMSKIIDTLPENPEDLSKIFTGANLEEDEATKIIDTVKKFK
ncbi:MAG TPA: hypothetical protein VJ208_02980 [Candidatus Nanoarchaeia archaeon]|nr:hypothetical protein [Candidatus Nanoarchaeia archaeon]